MKSGTLASILTAATLSTQPVLADSNILRFEPQTEDQTDKPQESKKQTYEIFQFDMMAGNPLKHQIERMCNSSETVHLTHQFPQMADPVVIAANCEEFEYSGAAYVAYDIGDMPEFLKLER